VRLILTNFRARGVHRWFTTSIKSLTRNGVRYSSSLTCKTDNLLKRIALKSSCQYHLSAVLARSEKHSHDVQLNILTSSSSSSFNFSKVDSMYNNNTIICVVINIIRKLYLSTRYNDVMTRQKRHK